MNARAAATQGQSAGRTNYPLSWTFSLIDRLTVAGREIMNGRCDERVTQMLLGVGSPVRNVTCRDGASTATSPRQNACIGLKHSNIVSDL
jgi:hypothetical protein